jgi:hypothetical protein
VSTIHIGISGAVAFMADIAVARVIHMKVHVIDLASMSMPELLVVARERILMWVAAIHYTILKKMSAIDVEPTMLLLKAEAAKILNTVLLRPPYCPFYFHIACN